MMKRDSDATYWAVYFHRADGGAVLFVASRRKRERKGEGEERKGEEGRVRCEGKEFTTRRCRDVDEQEP